MRLRKLGPETLVPSTKVVSSKAFRFSLTISQFLALLVSIPEPGLC